jgi:quercetin dioxygenase-like cupin family protein
MRLRPPAASTPRSARRKTVIVDTTAVRPPVRRVVTGHDTTHRAHVLWDEAIDEALRGKSGFVTPMWATANAPADIRVGDDVADPREGPHATAPAPLGTRFLVMDYPPGGEGVMHRTETLDYVVMVSGQIDLVTDDATVHLRAGDVVVQRGTNHAWRNPYTQIARLAIVLVDAKALGFGNPRLS